MIKFSRIIALIILALGGTTVSTSALPPPEDIPEEVLREEMILEGRSPLDGTALNAAEYAQLMQELSQSRFAEQLPGKVRHQVFLLELRRFLQTVTPF